MRVVSYRPQGMRGMHGICAMLLTATLWAPAAQAALFDDDEARRAILDMRQRLEQVNELQGTRQAALTDQIDQLRRSLLDLNNQLEQLRADNARLRGQNEELTRDVAELQRKQKDLKAGVDERMQRFEPQKVTVDGKEFSAEPDEKRQYEQALEVLRRGDFVGASTSLSTFRQRYPASGYTHAVLFWLGNAQYGNREYKEAIATFRTLVSAAPNDPKVPEALLAIANCHVELRDPKAARKVIEELVSTYPKSEAAQAGLERLASLK